jgi:hypothetical protein
MTAMPWLAPQAAPSRSHESGRRNQVPVVGVVLPVPDGDSAPWIWILRPWPFASCGFGTVTVSTPLLNDAST